MRKDEECWTRRTVHSALPCVGMDPSFVPMPTTCRLDARQVPPRHVHDTTSHDLGAGPMPRCDAALRSVPRGCVPWHPCWLAPGSGCRARRNPRLQAADRRKVYSRPLHERYDGMRLCHSLAECRSGAAAIDRTVSAPACDADISAVASEATARIHTTFPQSLSPHRSAASDTCPR